MTRFNAKNGGLMTRKISIRLDENQFQELDLAAMKEGTSVSFIVRHLVIRFLENRRQMGFDVRSPRNLGELLHGTNKP